MLAPDLLADLKTRIAASDVLQAHADAILATARPAIDLVLDGPSDGTLGETRFGGAPDLPANLEWPRNQSGESLVFLAQINLSDIPAYDDNPFPARGWLSVFIGSDEPATGVEHQLLLILGEAQLAPATVPGEAEFANDCYQDMAPQRLQLALRADIPRWATTDLSDLARIIAPDDDDAPDALDAYDVEEMLEDLSRELRQHEGGKTIGHLLGHAQGIGHDGRQDAFVVREVGPQYLYDYAHRKTLDMTRARNWLNLLCLESFRLMHGESFGEGDIDFCVWDAGYFNFLIHRDDLAKLDFARVYAAVESS